MYVDVPHEFQTAVCEQLLDVYPVTQRGNYVWWTAAPYVLVVCDDL